MIIYPFKTSFRSKHRNDKIEFNAIISKDNILQKKKLHLFATTELSSLFINNRI